MQICNLSKATYIAFPDTHFTLLSVLDLGNIFCTSNDQFIYTI